MSGIICDLLDDSRKLQHQFEASTSPAYRKQRGQYFTPKPICRFMAQLFSQPGKEFRLLDPGAGVGALTAAVCDTFGRLKSPRHLDVHLFENDPNALPLLDENMRICRRWVEAAGHGMDYTIHAADFITTAGDGFGGPRSLLSDLGDSRPFDGAIMNPPYFKITKESPHARLMAAIVHGQPNIYALFLALAGHLLRPGGELVAITPRSFCSGLYFRGFRRWFLQRMSLERLHLFQSRTETFKGTGVLQESVITHWRRSSQQSPAIKVSTSIEAEVLRSTRCKTIPADKVIDGTMDDVAIRIPVSDDDAKTVELVESLPARFAEIGLCISTGPVVLFRAAQFLVHEPCPRDATPLILPHNVKPFDVVWPIHKSKKPVAFRVCHASRPLLLPTRNYVLLKRFSAKEERRRLTAGCLLRSRHRYPMVALENHLNYIYHERRELSENEVFGIAAILNSQTYDRYFRLLSGNTQVNATEIRTMKFPPLSAMEAIGKNLTQSGPLSPGDLEGIVIDALGQSHWKSSILMESVT